MVAVSAVLPITMSIIYAKTVHSYSEMPAWSVLVLNAQIAQMDLHCYP